jgi:hypothetical protein
VHLGRWGAHEEEKGVRNGTGGFYARRLSVLHGEKKGGGVGVRHRAHGVGDRRVELLRWGARQSTTTRCDGGGRLSSGASRGRKATRVGRLFGLGLMNSNISE